MLSFVPQYIGLLQAQRESRPSPLICNPNKKAVYITLLKRDYMVFVNSATAAGEMVYYSMTHKTRPCTVQYCTLIKYLDLININITVYSASVIL